MEMILESNSDAHSSQDEEDILTVTQMKILTQIAHSEQYKLSTHCTPQVYRGIPMGYKKKEKKAPHVTEDYCTKVLHALLFNIIQLMM
jgi:hypothetical protein